MRRLHGYLPRLSFDVILDLFAVLQLLLQLSIAYCTSPRGKSHALPLNMQHMTELFLPSQQRMTRSCLGAVLYLHLGLQEKPSALFQLAIPLSQESLRHDHSLGRNQCSVLGIKTCSR